MRPWVSVVIPVKDERDNLAPLTEQLLQVLGARSESQTASFEILFVDDGSVDGSGPVLDQLAKQHDSVSVLHFDKNYGKTAALDAGFEQVRGQVIIIMDGDLQTKPADIETLLPHLSHYDMVCGRRAVRNDHLIRKISSRVGNAVRNAERLLNSPRFGPILREVRSPELLVLALLYHDVGKAREGDHSIVGADMAGAMSARLRLDEGAHQTVDFLIRHHLKMSRIAFRRDTEEPEVVRQFASLFSTEEHLKLLLLLTLCDVGAVSPDTLTSWKEELLWRLYVDAYNQMTLGYGDDIIDREQALVAALQANRPQDISEQEMAAFLEGLPRRYLLLFAQEAIYRHVRLSRDIRPNEAHFFLEKNGGVWDLTVVSLDKPFLFSNICGVLSYFGMDILRGHALTSLAGVAVDVFQFADREGFFERNSQGRQAFDRRLDEVVSGGADVTSLLKSKEDSVLTRRALVRRTPVVYFDTAHSQRYTVLELVADDAPGLLYRVSRVISNHGVDVDLVLISTEGQKAIDVFHITRGGAKLTEEDEASLKADLEGMLQGPPE